MSHGGFHALRTTIEEGVGQGVEASLGNGVSITLGCVLGYSHILNIVESLVFMVAAINTRRVSTLVWGFSLSDQIARVI